MITGFNTDVDHGELVFHVQTEDKGRDNPVVESLLYCGGEIITSRVTPYADLGLDDASPDEAVQQRMERQHQALIRDICNGKFDTEGPKPFGHSIISNRSLDEVAVEYLNEHCAPESIKLEVIDRQVLLEGTRPALRFKITELPEDRPVAGAALRIKLITTSGDDPRELFSSITDDDGFLEASFDIPELPDEDTAIFCEVEIAGKQASYKQLIEKSET